MFRLLLAVGVLLGLNSVASADEVLFESAPLENLGTTIANVNDGLVNTASVDEFV